MTVKTLYNELLAQEERMKQLRRGILHAQAPTPVEEMLVPPPVEDGKTALTADWERAIAGLEKSLTALETAVSNLEAQALENGWQQIASKLSRLETASRMVSAGRGMGWEAYAFDHAPLTLETDNTHLPANDCEIDYQRQCATLMQEEGWCSQIDISDAKIGWYVTPDGCSAEQIGLLTDVLSGSGNGWMLILGGSSQVVLHIDIALPRTTRCNGIRLDCAGRMDDIELTVDGDRVPAIDRGATWFAFPARTVQRIGIKMIKNSYDTDRALTHYFCLNRISVHLFRYKKSGVYVSHPIAINGTEAAVTPEISLPGGTSADLFLGLQAGRNFNWYAVEKGEWLKLPWYEDPSVEYFTYNPAEAGRYADLYELFRFEELPTPSSIILYPGHNMWVVERLPAGEGAAATLESWTKQSAGAAPEMSLLDTGSSMIVSEGNLYRLYTYAYVGAGDDETITGWRPHPVEIPHSVYINWERQEQEEDYYNLVFRRGWNLIEIILLPGEETPYAPLLDLEEAASITSMVRGSATIVTLDELQYGGIKKNPAVVAYHDGVLYTGYEPPGGDPLRFACRYHKEYKETISARVMVVMHSNTEDVSPVLTGFAVQWR